jgi:hypothetical protein
MSSMPPPVHRDFLALLSPYLYTTTILEPRYTVGWSSVEGAGLLILRGGRGKAAPVFLV